MLFDVTAIMVDPLQDDVFSLEIRQAMLFISFESLAVKSGTGVPSLMIPHPHTVCPPVNMIPRTTHRKKKFFHHSPSLHP